MRPTASANNALHTTWYQRWYQRGIPFTPPGINAVWYQRPSHHLVSTLVSTRYDTNDTSALHTTWYHVDGHCAKDDALPSHGSKLPQVMNQTPYPLKGVTCTLTTAGPYVTASHVAPCRCAKRDCKQRANSTQQASIPAHAPPSHITLIYN